MSRSGEMKDKYDKIRELQEQRDRREREAQSQADELDAILEASREAHGETPLVSSSRLSGPGFGSGKRRGAPSNPEDAYTANFAASRFASPEAFSRNRSAPGALPPENSATGLQQRTANAAAGDETRIIAQPLSATANSPEATGTITVKAISPIKSEVTQVVRRRAAQLGNRPRREPPPVIPANLAPLPTADGPAIQLPQLPQPSPIMEAGPLAPPPKRIVFVPPAKTPASRRMVTNRPNNYGVAPIQGSTRRSTHDTSPFGPDTKRLVMGRQALEDTTSDELEITAPGAFDPTPPAGSFPPEHDTSPGMGDARPLEPTNPGVTAEPTAPNSVEAELESTSPGLHDDPLEPTPRPDWPPDDDEVSVPQAPAAELTDGDARYKRVKEIDALIARFAADVEVKVGQGRENTFLRKRSEIVPPQRDDDFPDERTQPRHRNIEVRRENTEIIPRRLPPRKRK